MQAGSEGLGEALRKENACGLEVLLGHSLPSYCTFPFAEAVVNSQEWTLSRSIPELRLVGSPGPWLAGELYFPRHAPFSPFAPLLSLRTKNAPN